MTEITRYDCVYPEMLNKHADGDWVKHVDVRAALEDAQHDAVAAETELRIVRKQLEDLRVAAMTADIPISDQQRLVFAIGDDADENERRHCNHCSARFWTIWERQQHESDYHPGTLGKEPDGWIEFMDDRNPRSADTVIDIKLRSGNVVTGVKAGDCTWHLWHHQQLDRDIVAYRVVSE